MILCKAKYAIATVVLSVFNVVNVMAQSNRGVKDVNAVGSAISDATGQITGIFDSIATLCFVIAAIVGLVGGIQVYSKFSSGDPDGGKRIGKWVGGAVFMGLVPSIIKALFM